MLQLYRTLARYNQWMNQKLFLGCSRLSDEDRRLDRKAFFGSIHVTLNHLLNGDGFWMNRLAGRDYKTGRGNEILYDDFEELREARIALDDDIISWLDRLDDEWPDQLLTWGGMIDGDSRTDPNWLLLSHMFNHGTHHRGQVTTLLTQLGIDIGPTDLLRLPTAAGDTADPAQRE